MERDEYEARLEWIDLGYRERLLAIGDALLATLLELEELRAGSMGRVRRRLAEILPAMRDAAPRDLLRVKMLEEMLPWIDNAGQWAASAKHRTAQSVPSLQVVRPEDDSEPA